MKINDTDVTEAAKAISAVRRRDVAAFNAVFDGAVTRYGGLQRLTYAIAQEITKGNQDA